MLMSTFSFDQVDCVPYCVSSSCIFYVLALNYVCYMLLLAEGLIRSFSLSILFVLLLNSLEMFHEILFILNVRTSVSVSYPSG